LLIVFVLKLELVVKQMSSNSITSSDVNVSVLGNRMCTESISYDL
jgi:hypothetical protein